MGNARRRKARNHEWRVAIETTFANGRMPKEEFERCIVVLNQQLGFGRKRLERMVRRCLAERRRNEAVVLGTEATPSV